MHIALLRLSFYLHGCSSLKEKRGRLSGLRDKFGAHKHIAVCEADDQDSWQKAKWNFVVIGLEKGMIDSSFNKIIDHCQHQVDAELIDQQIEWL
ncbi:MAG: DUF503 domain-containing protein [Agarilytica sp.]